MMLKRGLLQLLLAALLLVAQYAALTHEFKHWQNGPAGLSQQDEGGKQSSKPRLCDFHGACAEVLGAINAAAPTLGIVAQTAERVINPIALSRKPQLLTPLSRGPPALL